MTDSNQAQISNGDNTAQNGAGKGRVRLALIALAGATLLGLTFCAGQMSGERTGAQAEREQQATSTIDVPDFQAMTADGRQITIGGNGWYHPTEGLPSVSNNALLVIQQAIETCARIEAAKTETVNSVNSRSFDDMVAGCANGRASNKYKVAVTRVDMVLR